MITSKPCGGGKAAGLCNTIAKHMVQITKGESQREKANHKARQVSTLPGTERRSLLADCIVMAHFWVLTVTLQLDYNSQGPWR